MTPYGYELNNSYFLPLAHSDFNSYLCCHCSPRPLYCSYTNLTSLIKRKTRRLTTSRNVVGNKLLSNVRCNLNVAKPTSLNQPWQHGCFDRLVQFPPPIQLRLTPVSVRMMPTGLTLTPLLRMRLSMTLSSQLPRPPSLLYSLKTPSTSIGLIHLKTPHSLTHLKIQLPRLYSLSRHQALSLAG